MISTSAFSARTRLTLWYVLVLGVMTTVFSAVILVTVKTELGRQLHGRIMQSMDLLEKTVREQPGELAELDEHVSIRYFKVDGPTTVAWVSASWKGVRLDGLAPGSSSATSSISGTAGGRPFRVEARVIELSGAEVRLYVAEEESYARQALRILALTLGVGLPLMLVLGVVAGRVLAGRVLAPLGTMATKARELTAEHLSERLPVANPEDEFGRLAAAFNSALGRLEESFERLRRFTSDASHELRTPLTTLRSVGEVGIQEGVTPEQLRETIGSMLEEVSRLTRLVDGLLTLTRAESGRLPLQQGPVDIVEVAREVIDYLRILAEEKRQTLSLDAAEPVIARADRTTLGQALTNVVENAVKYTPPGGHIGVRATALGGEAVLEVRDDGPGIAPEHRPHVFERFYRGGAPTGDAPGAGLGLSIAKWAVQLNHGRIDLATEPGRGSTFRIVVPAVAPDPDSRPR